RLQWPSPPICLDPTFSSFVHCASPNSHLVISQFRVGHFKHDAANIFVCEEVVARELHLIEIADCVEKEWIAAPTEEKRKSRASVTRASFPTETGAASTTTSPSSPTPAARAPSIRRTVAVCFPSWEDANCTRQPRSATASPSVSTFTSYSAPGAKGS